jgi:hypothetical protein
MKKGALCEGVILGVALVSVGDAERVLVPLEDTLAVSDELSVAVSLLEYVALSVAVSETLSVADSDADADAVIELVLVAVFEGVCDAVSLLDAEDPIVRLHRHSRVLVHCDIVSSWFRYRRVP